jgi:hypothetical protein
MTRSRDAETAIIISRVLLFSDVSSRKKRSEKYIMKIRKRT